MKKRDWLYVLLPLFASWVTDRVTKTLATHLVSREFFGFFGLILHHNSGAILGTFSDIPAVLRIVSLSTGGAFLLFLFGIIQLLLPTKSLTLRIGLSLLISGIIGNVTDRILWGYVVDFIVVGTPLHFSPAFNFADAIQWIGYGLLVTAFVKEGKSLWPEINARKKYWINPRFQLKYCMILVACGLGLTLILGVYSYTYLSVALNEFRQAPIHPAAAPTSSFLVSFVVTFGIVSATFCVILFAIGMVLSHRTVGPLHAFERFLNDHIEGKDTKLKLRAGDEFKQLESLANRLSSELNPKSSRSKSG